MKKLIGAVSALALIGTTHPKEDDLSRLSMPVIKIYGSHDGIAPAAKTSPCHRTIDARSETSAARDQASLSE